MKKSIERTLGLRPTREQLIKDHFRLCQILEAWKRDIRDLIDIVTTLRDLYLEVKSECCFCRQGSLKMIIEAAVTDYNNFCTLREVRLEMEASRTGQEGASSINRLRGSAMAIAAIQNELQAWERLNAEFEEVSTKDIEKQSELLRKEILKREWEYVNIRNKLEYLSDAAEAAQSMCCFSRYGAYNDAIKAVYIDAAIAAQQPTTS